MRALLTLALLLLAAVATDAVLAQPAAVGDAPVAAKSQPVPGSFEALPSILKMGQEVTVTDDTGETIRGEVVSISDTRLVVVSRIIEPVEPRHWWGRREREGVQHRGFAMQAVRTIDLVDSTWNGWLIGAAVGGASVVWLREAGRGKGGEEENFWKLAAPWLVLLGGYAGGQFDGAFNKRVYEHHPETVAIAPLIGRGRLGVMAQLRF